MTTTMQLNPQLGQASVKPVAVVALLAGLCLAGLSASATTISDNFDLVGPGRTAGAPLNGTTTMTGSASWVAPYMYVFKATGTDSATAGSLSATDVFGTARVNFTSAATDLVRVQADLHAKARAGNERDSWLGLQMGEVFAAVSGGGAMVTVWSNFGAGKGIGNFPVTSYNPNGLNPYVLEYNGTTKTLSAWANNQLLFSRVLTPDEQPGVIGFAGFKLNANEVGANSIDNFQVNWGPAP